MGPIEYRICDGAHLNELADGRFEQFPSCTSEGHFNSAFDYFCALRDGEVLAVAKLSQNAETIHVDMLEVAKDYRHCGVSKGLLHELVLYAEQADKIICSPGYTNDGRTYLAREISRILNDHPGRIELYPTA